ncbi:Dabb family protein [Paenibacillus sabinae]|uniref:Stress responsive alpha-beta barrel domain-containing protein n=1 Tax=Paenibacillus sabinae T27 TaxID=1268072 RepID=X4ZGY3_9BACL|nr:Dabb family protein [Paenibacillus sabinae]AHV98761.1 stress responsive alpha-beta barrel domain-containing protein [Paenibacillus sabinae T27]
MLINNLLIKLKDNSPEIRDRVRETLLGMRGQIESLAGIEVREDVRTGQSPFDLMLITRYGSMEDYQAYLTHPKHVEVSTFMQTVIESGASLLYED